jgi:hypothetical protein
MLGVHLHCGPHARSEFLAGCAFAERPAGSPQTKRKFSGSCQQENQILQGAESPKCRNAESHPDSGQRDRRPHEWGSARRRLYNIVRRAPTMFGNYWVLNYFGSPFSFFLICPWQTCYLLRGLSERIFRPRNVTAFRRWVYGCGVAFSPLLIFSPLIFNLVAAIVAY